MASSEPHALVPVTEIGPGAETEMDAPLAPVLQAYESAPVAVSVVLCPLQIASVPVMATVGAGPGLTVTEAVEEPHAFVAVAV